MKAILTSPPCQYDLLRLHGQRFTTRRHAKDEVVAWLLWYNGTRQHSTLDYVSPMQFEKSWLAAQPNQASS